MGNPTRTHRSVSTAALHSTKCMAWKERQRIRIPVVDLDDNPFCVERRVNEERYMMQLNRNPSLVQLTSADVPRTASFLVDEQQPWRDFERKKRQLLLRSLRDDGALHNPFIIFEHAGGGASPCRRRRGRTQQNDIDVDTMPNLEPYRREVVAQQPITFGHRPTSASRMFNPSTMDTSCRRAEAFSYASGMIAGGGTGDTGRGGRVRRYPWKGSAGKIKQQPIMTLPPGKRGNGYAPGLSAPMLKALLFRDRRCAEYGDLARVSSMATAEKSLPHPRTAPDCEASKTRERGDFKSSVESERGGTSSRVRSSLASFCHRDDGLSQTSNSNIWRSVLPSSSGDRDSLNTSRLSSSCVGAGRERSRPRDIRGQSIEEMALREIFSAERPPWDGTPAPLPAPRDVRRAVSSMLAPDPDERLRDKLAKFRKLAAGIPVTESSIREEKEHEARALTPAGRWEASPVTPRTILAAREMKRLVDERQERDEVMAQRVREAELRVFYSKIAGSKSRYRKALTQGLKRQGLAVAATAGCNE